MRIPHCIIALAALIPWIAPGGVSAQPTPGPTATEPAAGLDPHRPVYHFLPPKNWMNDPNGLIHFRGAYHLFYQYDPLSPDGSNPKLWGHAVSGDLVRWKHLPVALRADRPFDQGGVWSGCAVDDGAGATALYTGVFPEVQVAAVSRDAGLETWEKPEGNPVIAAPPPGLQVVGFRDPFVWKEGDDWLMVVGSGVKGKGGAILLYASKDLRSWTYLHPAAAGGPDDGEMWECPNLFPLGDRWVLTTSLLPMVRTFAYVGDWSDRRFTPQHRSELDAGGSFYAPQSFRDARGRRILFGWLREMRGGGPQKAAGWSGVMTLPRILTLRPDGRIGQEPAEETKTLRGELRRIPAPREIPAGPVLPLDGFDGDAQEIAAEIDPGGAASVRLEVLRSPDGGEATALVWDRAAGTLAFDLSRSSTAPDTDRGVHATPFRLDPGEPLRLNVFIDRSVVEVYANGGTCLTTRAYPARPDSRGVALRAEGGSAQLRSLESWPIRSVW